MGKLTKVSLAFLKACSSCGDRDWNWAKWQPPASGKTLRGLGPGTASVRVSTIAISTGRQPTAISVMRKDRKERGQGASGTEG